MTTLLRRLKCGLGIHLWWEIDPPVYHQLPRAQRLALEARPARRTCVCCGKTQVREQVCLGLNPPTYYTRWHDEGK